MFHPQLAKTKEKGIQYTPPNLGAPTTLENMFWHLQNVILYQIKQVKIKGNLDPTSSRHKGAQKTEWDSDEKE